MFPIHFYYL